MNLFGSNKPSYADKASNKRPPEIGRINTRINKDNNNKNLKPSNIFGSHSSHHHNNNNLGDGTQDNIQLFLRSRTELYLKHNDNDTALFFAERLLSECDNLTNRLLVSKCYKELHQFNKAYHVLQSSLRQKQTNYQRYLTHKKSASQHPIEQQSNDISFGIDPLTPIANTDDVHAISSIGFAFKSPMVPHTNNTNDNNININNHNNKNENGPFSMSFRKDTNMNDKRKGNMHDFIDKDGFDNPENVTILNEARYFLAVVCFELGRYDECEELLLGKKYSDSRHIELEIPDGVHGIYLLAKVFHKSSRFELAIKFYTKCIQIDSYHIGAIMALSELGKDPGLTQQSHTTKQRILKSEDCKIPIKQKKHDKNKNVKDVDIEYVELEKVDVESYKKVKLLFDNLSWGYFKLQMFYPHDALKYFNKLPQSHFSSAWVLNHTARCYYEMNDYSRAIINWSKQLDLYPYDMKGMDYYSTALWHLKRSKELTLLSQHCSEIDKLSPLTWMVMGNCFSLHKSHDLAIKFFKKAYCIDHNYAYAYTLAGHEYVVNEDFDSAAKSFQTALRIDERHYNAWYGLGNIYQFQQNYKQSLYHFKKAVSINPNSSVLWVCIATIYKLSSMYNKAIETLDKALALTNATGHHNLKARWEKANIYCLLSQYQNAIKEFEYLLQIIPNEWKIHFHLGEVYTKIGNKDQALLSFNRAMALNPKDKNTIKHAIQNVYQNQDEPYSVMHGDNDNRNHNRNYRQHRGHQRRMRRDHDDDNRTYQDILVEQDEEERVDDDDVDVEDELLDESGDDQDELMNISGSHDRSSMNAMGPSNSMSPN